MVVFSLYLWLRDVSADTQMNVSVQQTDLRPAAVILCRTSTGPPHLSPNVHVTDPLRERLAEGVAYLKRTLRHQMKE